MSKLQKPAYGGQAVIEGVMFGGKRMMVTAIRRKDQSIDYFHSKRKSNSVLTALKKIPFLRGIAAIVEASANGTQHLNFSSERYDVNPEDDAQVAAEQQKEKKRIKTIFNIWRCNYWCNILSFRESTIYIDSCVFSTIDTSCFHFKCSSSFY